MLPSPQTLSRIADLIEEMFTLEEFARVVYLTFGRRLDALVQQSSGRSMIDGMLSLCARQGTVTKILQAALDHRPDALGAGELKRILDMLRAARSPWQQPVDPFDAWLLNANEPFVNRLELRNALRDLSTDTGARVLLIDGEPKTGKTYTNRLISYLAHRTGFSLIWIDLANDAFTGYSPHDLVRSIAAQMGITHSVPRPREEAGARYAINVRDWLVGHLRLSEKAWWLVLDGVQQANLDPAVKDLIQHLMVQAHVNVRNLRVAALACREDFLPPGHGTAAHTERTRPISRDDLTALFHNLLTIRGVPFEDGAVNEAVHQVENLLLGSPGSVERMERLPRAVRTVADALFTASDALGR